ncbi:hypothetical protein D3C76_674100 [compost metagenome]
MFGDAFDQHAVVCINPLLVGLAPRLLPVHVGQWLPFGIFHRQETSMFDALLSFHLCDVDTQHSHQVQHKAAIVPVAL